MDNGQAYPDQTWAARSEDMVKNREGMIWHHLQQQLPQALWLALVGTVCLRLGSDGLWDG